MSETTEQPETQEEEPRLIDPEVQATLDAIPDDVPEEVKPNLEALKSRLDSAKPFISSPLPAEERSKIQLDAHGEVVVQEDPLKRKQLS